MAGAVEQVAHFWDTWGVHVMVLVSFTMQVLLLVLGDLRRRVQSSVLRSVVWSVYILADSAAIYALGHFFVSRRSPGHELMALWAPMLLVHLGGQDNITAYAVEDNRLWLRHLQTMCVQVGAASIVFYQSSILSSSIRLRLVAITMFVVGVLKYGERVWVLWRANGMSIHRGILGLRGTLKAEDWEVEKVYDMLQMHLSVMYSLFYTKGIAAGTYLGWCIRAICPSATFVALLLFHGSLDKYNYYMEDVTVTYILLAGAFVLEITSVLRIILSTVTREHLIRSRWSCCRFLGHRFNSRFQYIHSSMRKVGINTMYWSGSMGQLNVIYLCTRERNSRRNKIMRWRPKWGLQCMERMAHRGMEWLQKVITLDFSWSITVPTSIIELLMDIVASNGVTFPIKLAEMGFYEETQRFQGKDSEWDILVWHIATHVYLERYHKEQGAGDTNPRSPSKHKITEALSNYTIFLLAAHFPVEKLNEVVSFAQDREAFDWLIKSISSPTPPCTCGGLPKSETAQKIFEDGFTIGAKLISKGISDDLLTAISHLWVHVLDGSVDDMMATDFHIKQLTNGGEFLTFLTVMLE